MNDIYTPSELIYLYLDGEANDIQKTTLFTALGSDNTLQQEFNDALEMRKAFEYERSIAQPPIALTSRIFDSVGITETVVATTGTALLTASMFRFWQNIRFPFVASLCGAALMYFSMTYFDSINQTSVSDNAVSNQSVQPNANGLQKSLTTNETPRSITSTSAVSTSSINSSSQLTTKVYNNSTEHTNSTELPRRRTEDNIQSVATPTDDSPILNEKESYTSSLNTLPITFAPNSMHRSLGDISPRLLHTQPLTTIYGKNSDMSIILTSSGVGRITGVPAPQMTTDNIQLTGLYHLSAEQAIGIQMTRGGHTLTAFTGTDVLQNPVVTSLEAVYQYSIPSMPILGSTPFVTVSAGATTTLGSVSPILRSSTGLMYSINTALSLRAGCDFSTLFFSSDKTIQTSTTISGLVGLHFNL